MKVVQNAVSIDVIERTKSDGGKETKIVAEVRPSKSGAVAGATAGAAIGSTVPVVGTAVGAVVGGVIGFIFGPSDK